MVSPSKPNHSRVASHQQLHKCKLIKGPKPLTHFKFYLDIGKHHIENRIERLIKELGGSIEFFLAKDVTHFVTDKTYDRDGNLLNANSPSYLSPAPVFLSQAQKTPSPAPKTSLLLLTNEITSSDEKATSSKPRSRADAMVQRARTSTAIHQQQQQSHSFAKSPIASQHVDRCATSPSLAQNPTQLAQAWGTPIWSTDYTLKFLEKVSHTIKAEQPAAHTPSGHHSHHSHHRHHRGGSHVKHFHGNYLKIEARQKYYRPYYQEFAHWPRLKLDCASSPFEDFVGDNRAKQPNQEPARPPKQPAKLEISVPAATIDTPKHNKYSRSNAAHVRTVNALSPIEPATISILARNNITSIIESTMTRKTRNKPVRDSVDACAIKTGNDHDVKSNSDKCGYCEKCRVEYDVLSIHLQSKEHLNFVKNNDNYIAIDNLINSGTNVETFLRLNSDDEKNGLHSPKRLNNYLNHHGSFEDMDADNTATMKSPKQMNGVHNDDDVSPSKISRLPKYSPPITRRSQSKNSSQLNLTADEDNQAAHDTKKADEDDNVLTEADTNASNKSPSTKTMNGKKKTCDDANPNEPKAAAIADDSPVPEKRLVRAFPRYKVIGEGEETIMSRYEKSPKQYAGPKKSPSASAAATTASKRKQAEAALAADKNAKDLIVKFKRVRESELSKLTVEADNFMFPKPREEVLTDDDRQSTSERDGDQSSEVLSSDIGSAIDSSMCSSQNSSLTESAKVGGRRKKRVSQNDSFKSPAEPKQKFRTSLIQSRLNFSKQPSSTVTSATTTAAAATSGVLANVKPTRRNASASVARAVALTKATTRKSRKPAAKPAAAATTEAPAVSGDDIALDDRMREKQPYQGAKILETEYFKNMRYSFQRVPVNEPWYSTFKRQDEHRELVFEYWGNTNYRKLPYELGALPPLQSNCCFLSKLAEYKSSKQRTKTKRGNRAKAQQQQQQQQQQPPDDGIVNTDDADNDMDGETDATATSPCAPTKPKTSVNTNSSLSTMEFMASTLAACSEDEKDETSALSQLLMMDSMSLPGSSMPSSSSSSMAAAALAAKKRGLLVDAFGQPRKSPREHASTLAILSSLVQQRRKRIKEMNGGISPEKMPSYRAAVAAAIAAHQSSAENSGIDDHDDFNDDYDDASAADAMPTAATATGHTKSSPDPSKALCSPTTRRRSNQTPVFDNCKSPSSSTENGLRRSSTEQSDKFFRLRKVKRRQTESLSSTADSVADKGDDKADKEDKQAADNGYPKMPVDNYIDPIKLQRELEHFFEASFVKSDLDLELELGGIGDGVAVDLSLDGKQNDLVELLKTVKDGPLSYRTLTRTKKRHINKTGWPSLPRKRQPKREKPEDVTHTDEDGQPSVTNDDEPDRLSDIDEEELSAPAKGAIGERQDIRSPFCDDNAVPFAMFASSSEKAENSDIFTVSSDSYLDTDMNDTASKSRSTPINSSPLSQAKLRPNSHNTDDEADLSDATAGNDDGSQPASNASPAEPAALPVARPTSILERALMATRSKIVRSPIIIKEAIQGAINMKFQPMVCVQKISDKDLPQKAWPVAAVAQSPSVDAASPEADDVAAGSVSTSVSANASADEDDDDDVDDDEESADDADTDEAKAGGSRTMVSPKTKSSPRKLRKPRGRYYRD